MRLPDGSQPLDPGLRRDYLTFESPTKTQDSYGQDVITWSTYMQTYGNVRAMTGRELEAVQQRWAEARFKIRIPYPPIRVNREDRIRYGSPERTLDIIDAEDQDGVRSEMVIYAMEMVD